MSSLLYTIKLRIIKDHLVYSVSIYYLLILRRRRNKRGNKEAERLRNLPKVTELIRGKVGIHAGSSEFRP